jgi:replicative DNA helicase
MNDRQPVAVLYSQEAEASVLGGILVHPRIFAEVAPILRPEDFYDPANSAVYAAMAALDAQTRPIDIVSVWERMRSLDTARLLASRDGSQYLTELTSHVVTVENLGYHAGLIARKARRRRWSGVLAELWAASREDTDDDGFQAAAEQRIAELLQMRKDDRAEHIKPTLHRLNSILDERYANRDLRRGVVGIPTGLRRLDSLLSGLQPGDLHVVAGRPSMGKSTLMLNAAGHSAELGVHWLIFSLEMTKEALVEKMVATDSGVDSKRIRTGMMETQDFVHVTNSMSKLADRPIWIDDEGAVTIGALCSKAIRWAATSAKDAERRAIAVDYLQFVGGMPQPRGSRQMVNRDRELAEVTRSLKLLAKRLHCPVVALSQLNRSLESRSDKRPMLSDLRESGAIEQDADVIAFIYRDEVYSKAECKEPGIAEIIVAKQRMGPTAPVRVGFDGPLSKFYNLATKPLGGAPSYHETEEDDA